VRWRDAQRDRQHMQLLQAASTHACSDTGADAAA
jgi:hypothetical protein